MDANAVLTCTAVSRASILDDIANRKIRGYWTDTAFELMIWGLCQKLLRELVDGDVNRYCTVWSVIRLSRSQRESSVRSLRGTMVEKKGSPFNRTMDDG